MDWQDRNLLKKPDIGGRLCWFNEPKAWEPLRDEGVRVIARFQTDFFVDPAQTYVASSAPVLYVDSEGDFVARLCVRPTFRETYDAGGVMVLADESHWIKLCYEKTDIGPTAIVSVVTDGVSDDANGVEVRTTAVWLQIARKNGIFAMHHSLDGKAWQMVRYCSLGLPQRVKVGIETQSPVGPEAMVEFEHFSVLPNDLSDLRGGC